MVQSRVLAYTLAAVALLPAGDAASGGGPGTGEGHAAPVDWVAWQSAMESAFDRSARLIATPEVEMRVWEHFLETYSADNPLSVADERMREAAHVRIDSLRQGPRAEPTQAREALANRWKVRQAEMREAFDRLARVGEPDLAEWERFLAAFAQDNPLSAEDDRLRSRAREAIDAEKARQAAALRKRWDERQQAMQAAFERLTRDGAAALAWQLFLDSFAEDNPYTDSDDRLRAAGQRSREHAAEQETAARLLREARLMAMERALAELTAADASVEALETFLADHAEDIPETDLDEQMRTTAAERLAIARETAARRAEERARRLDAMATEFERLRATRSPIALWERFLAEHGQDIPGTERDDEMRVAAGRLLDLMRTLTAAKPGIAGRSRATATAYAQWETDEIETPILKDYALRLSRHIGMQLDYPARARRLGQQGQVVLQVTVSTNGRPDAVKLVESSGHPLLDGQAVEQVSQIRMLPRPPEIRGRTVTVRIPLVFKLEQTDR